MSYRNDKKIDLSARRWRPYSGNWLACALLEMKPGLWARRAAFLHSDGSLYHCARPLDLDPYRFRGRVFSLGDPRYGRVKR